jgi:cell division topological specificity factor
MNLWWIFNRGGSAPVARERLQIVLAHERVASGQSDLIAVLQREILDVVQKHVTLDRDKIQIKLERGEAVSMLEIDIEMPLNAAPKPAVASAQPAAA